MSREPAPPTEAVATQKKPLIFVSYAAANNKKNWVDKLYKEVNGRLENILGDQSFQIWIDHFLRGNSEFDQSLTDTVRASYVFLMIHSRAYHVSPWCRDEMKLFLKAQKEGASAFFVIKYRNDPMPEELADLTKYDFTVQEPETGLYITLGTPEAQVIPDATSLYNFRCDVLCNDIARHLEKRIKNVGMRSEARRPLQAEATPLELMKFVNLLHVATSEGLKENQSPNFTSALKGYEFDEREALFDALFDLIVNPRRG